MNTPDLEYIKDELFTRFIPNTPEGENAWRVMAERDGVAAVLNFEAPRVIRQLKASGYTVAKAKRSTMSVNDILRELEA